MADLEKLAGTIDGIEANVLKALEVGDKVKALDEELQSKYTEFQKEVETLKADGGKITDGLSKRLEDFERRYGRANGPDGKKEPEMSVEKSFGGQFVDWIERNRAQVHARDAESQGTPRISMKGATLRNHRAAVEFLGSQGLPATDENVRKALLLTDATNFAPLIRLPNIDQSLHSRRRVMRDLMQSRNIGIGNQFQYLRKLGMGENTANSMTSITSTLAVATATTAAAHGLRIGDRVQIEGATEAGYNGYPFVVTVPTATTFTYTIDPATADTTTGTIVWRTISRSGAAATVAEGALKPQSKLFYETVTGNVELIAHTLKISKQALDDVVGLQTDINADLIMCLADAEDYKFLYGTVASTTIEGLLTNLYTQTYTQAVTGDVGRCKAARHLVTLIRNVGGMATGSVINPNDWELFDTSVGLDDHWLLPGGINGNEPRLWRVPLAETSQIAPGTILMGDFTQGAFIVDREAPSISFADQNNDDFEKNMYTIRAEERVGLAITRPQMFAKLTLTT